MSYLVETILEKHAMTMPGWLKNTSFGQWYSKTKKSPLFKTKKAIGTGLGVAGLAAAPILYAGHKLSKPPEPIQPGQTTQQNMPAY